MSRARQDRTAARGCGQPHPSRPCAHLPAARGLLGRQCVGVVRLVKQIMQPSTSQEIDRYLPTGEHNAPPNSSSWVIWLHMKGTTKPEPTWRDVKAKLGGFHRTGLLRLLKDLHELSGDSHAFLNARLGLGAAPLVPFALDRAGRDEGTGHFRDQGQKGDFGLQEGHRHPGGVASRAGLLWWPE